MVLTASPTIKIMKIVASHTTIAYSNAVTTWRTNFDAMEFCAR
jgi:hypothetical protein